MSCNEFQPKNLTISRNLHSSLEFALLCSVVRFEPEKYQLSYHNKLDKPCIVKFVTSCSGCKCSRWTEAVRSKDPLVV